MSTYRDILEAVQSRVWALAIENLPTPSVVLRKDPVYLAEHDPLPLLVISPVIDGVGELQFNNNGFFEYEVRLTLYHETGVSWALGAWLLDMRQTLRRSLFTTSLTGASTVFDGRWNPTPLYDVGLLRSGVDVMRMSFTYTSSEAREA